MWERYAAAHAGTDSLTLVRYETFIFARHLIVRLPGRSVLFVGHGSRVSVAPHIGTGFVMWCSGLSTRNYFQRGGLEYV